MRKARLASQFINTEVWECTSPCFLCSDGLRFYEIQSFSFYKESEEWNDEWYNRLFSSAMYVTGQNMTLENIMLTGVGSSNIDRRKIIKVCSIRI